MPNKLLIRADGGAEMGLGHVMRCLALAQAWQDVSGDAVFAMVEPGASLKARIEGEGFRFKSISVSPGSKEDSSVVLKLAKQIQADWIVVDGYQFGSDYQGAIKDAGFRLLVFDDYGQASHYFADVVLNQNVTADQNLYNDREKYTQLLIGPDYVQLRREFSKWRGWKRNIAEFGSKVLVTLGGGDSENVTSKVIEAMEQIDTKRLETKVCLGSTNPHIHRLQSQIKDQRSKIELLVDAREMPDLMAWADVAISGSGSTSWELAFMGLPAITLILAANQREIGLQMAQIGATRNLGSHAQVSAEEICRALEALLVDRESRAEMSARGLEIIDGLGADRVIPRLRGKLLGLRPATAKDRQRLWKWANDEDVRAVAFNSAPIPWKEHVRWFEHYLRASHKAIFIGSNQEGLPIGQVRLEWNAAGEATMDVSVDAEYRGKGLGSLLIRRAAHEAFENMSIRTIHAYIKSINAASIRAFEKAGFRNAGPSRSEDENAVHMALSGSND